MSYAEAQNMVDLFRFITKKFPNDMTVDDAKLMTEIADNIEAHIIKKRKGLGLS